jgi:hypothetical protein
MITSSSNGTLLRTALPAASWKSVVILLAKKEGDEWDMAKFDLSI